MKYISLGAVLEPSTEHIVKVSHCGIDYTLTQELASLWLDGRFGFAKAENNIEMKALDQLFRMGLVMTANESDAGEYRALTQCRMVPVKRKNPYMGLTGQEKTIMTWLREAGLVLTISELVFLMDRNIVPTRELLGSEHAQKLVETIYTKENIFDNLLDNQMEHAQARDKTVKLIMKLLKKRKLVLL